jgi:hypothetical protein
MLASVSQGRDDAAHAQTVEAGRADGGPPAGGDHRVRTGLRQDRDAHFRQVLEERAHHDVSRIFTFDTDQPVYPPWYMGDNPASGEGFEAAVAYAVAAKMKFASEDVRLVRVPFNAALAPGSKTPHWLLGQRRSTPTCLSSRSPNSAGPRWICRRRISA